MTVWKLHRKRVLNVITVLLPANEVWKLYRKRVSHVTTVLPPVYVVWKLYRKRVSHVITVLPPVHVVWKLYRKRVSHVITVLIPVYVVWKLYRKRVSHVITVLPPVHVVWKLPLFPCKHKLKAADTKNFRLAKPQLVTGYCKLIYRVKRNSRTSSPLCDSLLKICRKCYTTYVLRSFVFEIHVTVKWGNTLLSSVTCLDDALSSCDNGRRQLVKACSRECRAAHCRLP
jgi:hypothetical protein